MFLIPTLRRWRIPTLALIALAICGVAGAHAAVTPLPVLPDCGPPVTLAADADAWIDQNSSTNNFGSDAILKVRAEQPHLNFRALVRFPLPSQPTGCVIEAAALRVYGASTDAGSRLEAVRLASGWAESQVTWSNQPSTTGAAAAIFVEDGYLEWSVSSQVQAMYDEGANHGFQIRDVAEETDGGEQQLHGREKGENPPQLVVGFRPAGLPIPTEPLPPTPKIVSCGEVLLRSTLVLNDLSACPDDGLVIGASRIILDLGGRTIDGTGLGAGVRNRGYDSVTIRNGTVQEFDYGVRLQSGANNNVVEDLSLQLNQLSGIEVFDTCDGNQIRRNTLTGNRHGITLMLLTSRTVVVDNALSFNGGTGFLLEDSSGSQIERNGISDGGDLGILLTRSSGNTLRGNTISGNSDGGIDLVEGSSNNLVEGNTTSGNNDHGIALLGGSNGNRIAGNTLSLSGDAGVRVVESHHNVLSANVSHHMSDAGIFLSLANDNVVEGNDVRFNPGGLQIDGSLRNLLQFNNASNSTGIGIEVGDGSFENWIAHNTTNENGAQGIYLGDEALEGLGNLALRNTANGNLSDGIATGKGGHTITANTANNNGGWGINGFLGTIDGGGNFAIGNAKAEPCIGVVCNGTSPDPPDGTPPDTAIGSRPAASTMSTSARFTFFADQIDVTFECSLDQQPLVACSMPTEYTDLAVGAHDVLIRAKNSNGLVDATPASYRWIVDQTPPKTTILSGPTAETPNTVATFTFSGSDNVTPETGLLFECLLDLVDPTEDLYLPCLSPIEYTGLTVGAHELLVRAIDAAGNVEPEPAVYTWTVDLTLPNTTVLTGPPAETTSTTANFTFTGTDNNTPVPSLRFRCSLDGAEFAACTSPVVYTGLPAGQHTFQVRAVDVDGKIDPEPAAYPWTVIDTTPPQTTIGSGPVAETEDRSATFAFSGSDNVTPASQLRFECALDGGTWTACATPATLGDLSLGAHAFAVRAIDLVGNTDPTPASYPWTVVDRTPPESEIISGPRVLTNTTSATFVLSSNETGSTFACALDGGDFAPCASTATYGDLAEGSHAVAVRATDPSGNTDATAASYAWTIDLTPPESTIDSQPEDPTPKTTATLGFSSPELSATFECALDSEGFATCASAATYPDLSDGEHTFAVRAIDEAGNADQTPASVTWTIDTIAPETTIAERPVDPSNATSAAFRFTANESDATFACSLDGVDFAGCASGVEYPGLTEDTHTFAVRATDPAGNTDQSPARHTWTIDTTPPAIFLPGDITAEATGFDGAVVTFVTSATDSNPASPEVSCAPASGSTFALGSTSVTCTATDAAGNTASGSFVVAAVDTSPPALTLPAPITAEATSPDGADVAYTASATDVMDGDVAIDCRPAGGATFPLDATTVNCTAIDAAGNEARGSFTVTVVDTTPPDLTVPGDVIAEAQGPDGAIVGFEASARDAVGGTASVGGPGGTQVTAGVALACTPAPGTEFSLGETGVSCTATDAAGNAETKDFTVTVRDTTAPELDLPANIAVEATGPAGAIVEFTAAATDLVDGNVLVGCDPASGATFRLGTTDVACSATDAVGNTANGSFAVTVADRTAPILTVPADFTAEATGPDGTAISFTATAEDIVDSAVTVTCDPASGSLFPLETTTVTCSATDDAGNSSGDSFAIEVVDTTPPTLADVPADVTAEATSGVGAAVDYAPPTATDFVDGIVDAICNPEPGATFPLGSNTVTCTATDERGNTATDDFVVTVVDTTPPALIFPTLAPIEATGPDGATVELTVTADDLVDGLRSVVCTPPSGSAFALGTSLVDCSASDTRGNVAHGSFEVTVEDTTLPTLIVPGDLIREAHGPTGAAVSFIVSASDTVDGSAEIGGPGGSLENRDLALVCTPAPGTLFAFGDTTVTCTATDASGNAGSASFEVTVADTTPPLIDPASVPANMIVEATGAAGAVASFASPTATDLVDGEVGVVCDPISGSTFALDTTAVVCTAVDAIGNADTAEFSVTVVDTTPPTVAAMDDIAGVEATSANGAAVTYESPAATDAVSGSLAVTCAPESGSTFALGDATVTCTATDGAGNIGISSFQVTVVDTLPPVFTLPASFVAEATGPDGAAGVFAAAATDLVDGTVSVDCTPASDSIFPFGPTDVTCSTIDTAGNTATGSFDVTVEDTTGPTISVENAEAEATGPDGATVNFSASAVDLVDGIVAVACDPAPGATFPVGATTVTCTATDSRDNTTVEDFIVTVADRTAPVLSVPAALNAEATGSGGAAVTFVASAEDLVDGAVPVACDLATGTTFLLGTTAVTCSAIDAAGNVATGGFIVEVVDTTPPVLAGVPADLTVEASGPAGAAVTYAPPTATDLVDGAVDAACSPAPGALFPLGSTPVTCEAADAAGNSADATFTVTVVDTTAPQTTIDSHPPAITASTSAMFTFSASETGSTLQCALDGATFAPCTSPAQLTVAEGRHDFHVRAIDPSGNADASPASHAWTVDKTPPDTAIASGPANLTNSVSAIFTFGGSDDMTLPEGLRFECRLDNQAFAACASPQGYAGLAHGPHTFEVRAVDLADNADPSPASRAWTVDTTSPDTTITSGPALETTSTSAAFAFSSNEGGVTFACALDGGTFAVCASPAQYTGLALGAHTFQVRATDAAGNVDGSPATSTWRVVAPTPVETTINSAPPASTTSTTAAFAFSANLAGATFQCSLDGAAFAACASPITYSGLAVSAHTFQVRAIDTAGNVDATPASYGWTVLAPSVTCGTPVTVTANADSWIDQNSATNNFGSDSILKVRSKNGNNNMRALVRFALPTVPAGCVVESATLRLFVASGTSGRTLQAIPIAGNWSESSVTWNNQPGTTGSVATTASGNGYREWGVAAQVQAMYAGANQGFLIRDAVENGDAEQQIHGREKGENPPQLVIRFATAGTVAATDGLLITARPESTIHSIAIATSARAGAAIALVPARTEAPRAVAGFDPARLSTTPTDTENTAAPADPSASLWHALAGGPAAACARPLTLTMLADDVNRLRDTAADAASTFELTPARQTWTAAALPEGDGE